MATALTPGNMYGDGTDSTMGTQLQTYYYHKKALIELKKEKYFSPMASVIGMPKHMGKTIKQYLYLPILDDRNTNDQGIDAAGALTVHDKFYAFSEGALVPDSIVTDNAAGFATAALVATAVAAAVTATSVTAAVAATYAVTSGAGNMYASSKDVGTIAGKMPALSETGGRVNRVGFTRLELESTLEKQGFFRDYTKESVDFDTDAELEMHINREMLRAANEMTEDNLQIELLCAGSVNRFAGTATTKATVSGNSGSVCEVTYANLSALSIELDNNRCPKETKIISGTRMVDTKVIPAARALLCGSEMIPTFERMKDHHDNPAFIPLAHYAAGTSALNGEIGSVGNFRIIIVPEMMKWAGAGAAVGTNAGYLTTGTNYDVFPLMVIGSESFTTVGFETNGKSTKFTIYHKKPGYETADWQDPFGEKGFMSIKWYHGFMVLRPERIAVFYSVARI